MIWQYILFSIDISSLRLTAGTSGGFLLNVYVELGYPIEANEIVLCLSNNCNQFYDFTYISLCS